MLDYNKKVNMMVPCLFIVKRLVFTVLAFAPVHPLIAIIVSYILAFVNLAVILCLKPFNGIEHPYLLMTEVFNDSISGLFMIILLSFVGDYNSKSD
jgi:hypothetical protein